jgi:hypothetical protein
VAYVGVDGGVEVLLPNKAVVHWGAVKLVVLLLLLCFFFVMFSFLLLFVSLFSFPFLFIFSFFVFFLSFPSYVLPYFSFFSFLFCFSLFPLFFLCFSFVFFVISPIVSFIRGKGRRSYSTPVQSWHRDRVAGVASVQSPRSCSQGPSASFIMVVGHEGVWVVSGFLDK